MGEGHIQNTAASRSTTKLLCSTMAWLPVRSRTDSNGYVAWPANASNVTVLQAGRSFETEGPTSIVTGQSSQNVVMTFGETIMWIVRKMFQRPPSQRPPSQRQPFQRPQSQRQPFQRRPSQRPQSLKQLSRDHSS